MLPKQEVVAMLLTSEPEWAGRANKKPSQACRAVCGKIFG